MAQMYIGLGSNKGNRSKQLSEARAYCQHFFGPLTAISPIYETAAWGVTDQPDFLNQVVCLETGIKPEVAIYTLQAIENLMGRVRQQRWGPRVIDVDMLFYDDVILETKDLQLPHPRIAERNFVLEPLAAIAPDFIDPLTQMSIQELLKNCKDTSKIWLYGG